MVLILGNGVGLGLALANMFSRRIEWNMRPSLGGVSLRLESSITARAGPPAARESALVAPREAVRSKSTTR